MLSWQNPLISAGTVFSVLSCSICFVAVPVLLSELRISNTNFGVPKWGKDYHSDPVFVAVKLQDATHLLVLVWDIKQRKSIGKFSY